MHPNAALIEQFYQGFQKKDHAAMAACYHPDIHFSDPVFTDLKGFRAGAMWHMLTERGKDLTTVALAESLTGWQQEGGDIAFVIGGADGLDPALKAKARMLIRLSSLTLPHGMVRVLLAEQLYRASAILNNHPYHRV